MHYMQLIIKNTLIVILALVLLYVCQDLGYGEYYGDYFTDSVDFQSCRDNGFTKEFCLRRPNPDQCVCENGQTGTYKVGFLGKCVCDNSNSNANSNAAPKGWKI